MREVTIPVPETDEERQLLGRFYRDYGAYLLPDALEPRAPVADADVGTAPVSYTGPDGEANLRRFLREVHGVNARRALRIMAEETMTRGVPDSDQVRARLGLETGADEPNRLGGMLTSIGFAMRRLPGFPRPYKERWGHDRQTYVLDEGVAEALLRLLDAEGNIQ
jgi:hypothetical protein